MAQKIQKKFIGEDQIDGSKIKLSQGESLRATDHTGVEVDLIKIDSSSGSVQINGVEPASKSDLESAQSDIAALQSDVSTAQSDISSLDSRLDTAESDIVSAEGRLDTAESEIVSAKSRLDTAESDINSAESRLNTAESDINNVEARVGTSESNISSLQGRMSDAESNISTALGDISSLSNRVGTSESDILSLESDVAAIPALIDSEIQSQVLDFVGVANGVAPLDSNGKVASSFLPSSIVGALKYKGLLDASNGSYPSSPEQGDYYVISVEGSISGHLFHEGDWAVFNGSSWDDIDNSQKITSVNNKTGVVVLSTSDIEEGSNQYFTEQRASDAAPVQSVAGKVGAVTLSSDDISEGSNLFFTEERASDAAPVQSVAGKTGEVLLVKADVGLENVDNTSDLSKPISTAVQTALDLKQNSLGSGTSVQFLRGDLQWTNLSSIKAAHVYTVGVEASTIAGCIALCVSPSNTNNYIIEIPPGTYTENLTIPGNVHLKGLASPNDSTSVVISGQHTILGSSANALNNRVVLSNILFSNSHASTATLSVSGVSASTQVVITGSYFYSAQAASTAKHISIGAFGSVYIHSTVMRASGGKHFIMQAGASLYSMYGLDIDGGACVLDMQGQAYAQFTQALLGCNGSEVIKIAANGMVTMGYSSITNAAAIGHGVNLAGAGASFFASHTTFNVVDNASSYAVTGVAGSYYGFFAINFSNIPGVATRNVKIGSSVTQLRYSNSLSSSDISDFVASAKSATVVNAINSGVTDTAPSQGAVYSALSSKLPKTGGTMTGEIAMSNQKITGLATPTSDFDASTKKYVDDQIAQVSGAAVTQAYVDDGDSTTLDSANSYTDQKVADLLGAAPSTLDTLNELAAALGNDENFATTIANQLGAISSDVSALQSDMSAAQSDISSAQTDISDLDSRVTVVESSKLDKTGGTMTGAIAMSSQKITGLSDPSAASQDAATAAYVDSMGGILGGQTANGTPITLTSSQKKVSFSSGSTGTSVILPSLSSLVVGSQVTIVNNSSAAITVRNPANNATVVTVPSAHFAFITLANKSGDGTFGSNLTLIRTASGYNVGNVKITNLAAPTANSSDAATSAYVDSAIAALPVFEWKKVKIVMGTDTGGQLAYADLSQLAVAKSTTIFVGRLAIHEGEDYTISTVSGVTRITFIGDLVNPGGLEAIESGDNLFVQYQHQL